MALWATASSECRRTVSGCRLSLCRHNGEYGGWTSSARGNTVDILGEGRPRPHNRKGRLVTGEVRSRIDINKVRGERDWMGEATDGWVEVWAWLLDESLR